MEWSPQLETALFQAVILHKPIGIHKHFKYLLMKRFLMNTMGVEVSMDDLKAKLNSLYQIDYTDDIPETEFYLPFEEYDDIISRYRQATEDSQSETEQRTKKNIRKTSRVLRKKKQ
jgi:MRG-binding protein